MGSGKRGQGQAIQVHSNSQGVTVVVPGSTAHETVKKVQAFMYGTVSPKERHRVEEQFEGFYATKRALQAPAELGESFSPIPQLCLELDGHLETVERETLTSLGDWNLAVQPVQLANFTITETVNTFEITVDGAKIKWGLADSAQLHLDDAPSHVSQADLVSWLDRRLRQPDVSQPQMQKYLLRLVEHLIHDKGKTLTALVRARFQLAQAIEAEIKRLREVVTKHGFQLRLGDMVVPTPDEMQFHSFRFQPGQYPARNVYHGAFEFKKHFYPVIHDLHEKTPGGAYSEEFLCAIAIDSHPKVRYWVRNIERERTLCFWLPTSSDYFYPDFVAVLTDDRILAVEYKGQQLASNDDSREKGQVGHRWEAASNGRCIFLLAVKLDPRGCGVREQLAEKLA